MCARECKYASMCITNVWVLVWVSVRLCDSDYPFACVGWVMSGRSGGPRHTCTYVHTYSVVDTQMCTLTHTKHVYVPHARNVFPRPVFVLGSSSHPTGPCSGSPFPATVSPSHPEGDGRWRVRGPVVKRTGEVSSGLLDVVPTQPKRS